MKILDVFITPSKARGSSELMLCIETDGGPEYEKRVGSGPVRSAIGFDRDMNSFVAAVADSLKFHARHAGLIEMNSQTGEVRTLAKKS